MRRESQVSICEPQPLFPSTLSVIIISCLRNIPQQRPHLHQNIYNMHTEQSPCSPRNNKSSPADCFMLSEAPALTTVHFMPIVLSSFFFFFYFIPLLLRHRHPPHSTPQSAPSFSFRSTMTDSCARLIKKKKKLATTRGKMLAAAGGAGGLLTVPNGSPCCFCMRVNFFLIWQRRRKKRLALTYMEAQRLK